MDLVCETVRMLSTKDLPWKAASANYFEMADLSFENFNLVSTFSTFPHYNANYICYIWVTDCALLVIFEGMWPLKQLYYPIY